MTNRDHRVISTGTPPWKSPVALSVFLHLLIVVVALAGWSWTGPVDEPPPRSISARLISQQQPEPGPVMEPDDRPDRDQQRRAEEEERKKAEAGAERRRQEEEARRIAEQKAREEEARRNAE
ncbi:MAG: protein TolA, partial [Pseudomonadota bacterium]|nr:protein TolA [Pseudomonadota bacterium]